MDIKKYVVDVKGYAADAWRKVILHADAGPLLKATQSPSKLRSAPPPGS